MVVAGVGDNSYYQILLKGTIFCDDESVIEIKLSCHFDDVNKIGMISVGGIFVAVIVGYLWNCFSSGRFMSYLFSLKTFWVLLDDAMLGVVLLFLIEEYRILVYFIATHSA